MTRALIIGRQSFPIRGTFRISRGSKTSADVVVATIIDDDARGRGECVPYARYGETVESVIDALNDLEASVVDDLDRESLAAQLPGGAARNALDCALWDLEAKQTGTRVWELAGLPAPKELVSAFTLVLDTPEAMAAAARAAVNKPLLKLKLGGDGDLERVRAVRAAASGARLIVDANEAWTLAHLVKFGRPFHELGVEMIEQPLPADKDEEMRGLECPVPLGADESFHGLDDMERLKGLYRVLNVKLDKCGGLTEALKIEKAAKSEGFGVMVGCMVASSLAMAPAVVAAQGADYVDLDGPLLLARDREPGLPFDGAFVGPPPAELWG